VSAKRVKHRKLPHTPTTFCGKLAKDADVTLFDKLTTCRNCLRAMGRYERRAGEWEHR
jgi:hypothetical protein